MGNRCPDCGKFVSLESEVEVNSLEIDSDDGSITGEVRIVLMCADCSTEMKETVLNIEDPGAGDWVAHITGEDDGADPEQEHDLEIEDVDSQAEDYMQNTDRHGKAIRNYRYMKHMYRAVINATITCSCGETWDVELSTEANQASGFDDLN